jgi:autotransporter-associated beta strand protein
MPEVLLGRSIHRVPNGTGTLTGRPALCLTVRMKPQLLAFQTPQSCRRRSVREVDSIVFEVGASAYTIAMPVYQFSITGTGIVNNSGITQNFVTGSSGWIYFGNSATAGSGTTFTNNGLATSSAGAGLTFFDDSSSAGNASFISNGATLVGGAGAITWFIADSTADHGTFTANPSVFAGADPGQIEFDDSSTAADGTFTLNGGTVDGAFGGVIVFVDSASAGNAIIIANGGSNGAAGGLIYFRGESDGGTARLELLGNGNLNLITQSASGLTIGSLEGSGGRVLLGTNNLTIGRNNLSTEFLGVIEGAGSITKIGTGNLTLSNANTYMEGTVVNGGTLLANNLAGSGTGNGPVQVMAGTFGGGGTVAGPVTIGTGHGAGAVLAPGTTGIIPGAFVIENKLQLMPDATLKILMDSGNQSTDMVTAKGIRIRNAQILFSDRATSVLPKGTAFTVISNTAGTPISGTFANLADGATVVVGNNTFQANYEGGDGNDLTLTVVSL